MFSRVPPKESEPVLATIVNKLDEKHFVLYEEDSEYKAVKFATPAEARVFAAGLKHANNDDIHLIGVVSNLISFGDIKIIDPPSADGEPDHDDE